VPFNAGEKNKIESDIHRAVVSRDPRFTNFLEYRNYKIIYRRYAGLYFSFCVDINDNELGVLEFIHLFVEVLDGYFGNVCELDLVFHFDKVYAVLDEMVLSGEISETSALSVLEKIKDFDKLE
jgi:hypothetical protein